ncbi:MAG: transcriptional regulator [Candidatus Bathyarchaeia archaeon]
MSKDQAVGLILLIVGVFGILLYGWLVFLTQWSIVVLQLTGFAAVAAILAIVSWIGYTMATTPPPKPIEEIESELKEEEKTSETATQ